MKLDKVIRLEKSFVEQAENIYNNGTRFCWSHDEINRHYREHILQNEDYRKMPRYAQSFVEGARHLLDKRLWKEVVFSYEVKGKRLATDSPKYRKYSAEYIHKHCSETGCFVYRSNPDKMFTFPTSSAI